MTVGAVDNSVIGTANNSITQSNCAKQDNQNIVIRGCRKIGKVIVAALKCFINAVKFIFKVLILPKNKSDYHKIAAEVASSTSTESKTKTLKNPHNMIH